MASHTPLLHKRENPMKLLMNEGNELKIPASPFRKNIRKSFRKKKHRKNNPLKGNLKALDDISKNDNQEESENELE